jgi:AcrR family transcriptional regulator
MPGSQRERILEAALACVGRYGLAKTTVEDVARSSGLARATVYRYFPKGRDQLMREMVAWEAERFFRGLAAEVGSAGDLVELLVRMLRAARRAVGAHQVLRTLLETEPELLLAQLSLESGRLVGYIRAFLEPEVRARVALDERAATDATDYLARMVLSYVSSPGEVDFSDEESVRRLVSTRLLAWLQGLDNATEDVLSSHHAGCGGGLGEGDARRDG